MFMPILILFIAAQGRPAGPRPAAGPGAPEAAGHVQRRPQLGGGDDTLPATLEPFYKLLITSIFLALL